MILQLILFLYKLGSSAPAAADVQNPHSRLQSHGIGLAVLLDWIVEMWLSYWL